MLKEKLIPSGPEGFERKYHYTKIRDESLGYRLLENRTEATMLTACSVGSLVVLVPVLIDLGAHGFDATPHALVGHWSLRIILSAALTALFLLAGDRAWSRHLRTVSLNYSLLLDADPQKQTGVNHPE